MKAMKIKSYIYILVAFFTAIVVLSSCYDRKRFPEPSVQQRTLAALISDLRATPNTRTADPLFAHYSTFKAAIQKTGLDEMLRDNSRRFIVFAPDDLAFEQLGRSFRNAETILTDISGTIDSNGDPVQPQYNDSLFLRTILLNHIVEVPTGTAEIDINTQSTFSSMVVQPTNFLPASNPLNTPWINNRITITPAQGVQGSLTFVPPAVNGAPMFSWGTKASNGTLNQISAILFPATAYEFLKKDGRHPAFANAVDFFSDVVAYLSDPNANITLFAARGSAPLPNIPNTKTRIQHHILSPSIGRLANLAPSVAIKYLPNLNPGRSTGIRLLGITTCFGPGTGATFIIVDPQASVAFPSPGSFAVVGYTGLTAYDPPLFTCIPPAGLASFIAVSNGIVYSTSGLLAP